MNSPLASLLRRATPVDPDEAQTWQPPALTNLPDAIDRELSAQTDAYTALARLDPAARARVLRWLREVLEVTP